MREIKFRAFDVVNEKIVKVDSIDFIHNQLHFLNETFKGNPTFITDYKLMQYTGLTDKNRVEIYEGDIVIVENYNHHGKNPNKVMFVYYDNLTAQYCTKIEKTNCKIEDLIMENQPLCFAHSIEIIGNIYKNKELLNTDG